MDYHERLPTPSEASKAVEAIRREAFAEAVKIVRAHRHWTEIVKMLEARAKAKGE